MDFSGLGSPPREEAILGVVPALKCIRMRKQQTPQKYRATDLSAGDSASQKKCGFEMDSPPRGTSAEAMRLFVKIIWPLLFIVLSLRTAQ